MTGDPHKINQRLESLRDRNDYDIIESLDSHLSLNLENKNSHHHYIMLLRAYKIKDYDPDRDLSDLDEGLVRKILTEIENDRYAERTDSHTVATKNKFRKGLDYLLRDQGKHWDNMTPRGVNIYQQESQKKTDKKKLMNTKELNKFLRALSQTCKDKYVLRNEAFFYTMWNTGARIGAVRNIRVDQITIEDDVVAVTVPPWKDSPKRPDLPLYFAGPVLKRYISTLPDNQEYLFLNREGNRVGYNGQRKICKKTWEYLEEQGEIDVEFSGQPNHVFRKSFKTYAGIMDLLGPNDLDIWTGHALGSTQIKQIYDRRDTESAGNKMREALGLETNDKVDWKEKIAPQSCKSCGQKNSSHRQICFSCGGVLKSEELPGKLSSRNAVDINLSARIGAKMAKNPDKTLNEIKEDVLDDQ